MLKKLTFRANQSANPEIPLSVRSCGHYILPQGETESHKGRPFLELYWVKRGSLRFHLSTDSHRTNAQQSFFYLPNEPHQIEILSQSCEYHWLTLDNNKAPNWCADLGLRKRPSISGPCPSDLFQALLHTVHDFSSKGEHQSSYLALQILSQSVSTNLAQSESAKSTAEKAKEIVDNRYIDAKLNVDQFAQELETHRATLFRSFKRRYGLSTIEYLKHKRIQHALNLLRETEADALTVCHASGFSDPAYFSRSIKGTTGFPPGEFRKQFQSKT